MCLTKASIPVILDTNTVHHPNIMSSASPTDSAPFIDSVLTSKYADDDHDSTLTVGKNTSLSLASDFLVILGTYNYSLSMAQGIIYLLNYISWRFLQKGPRLLWSKP